MSKFPLDAAMFESLNSLTHPVDMCGPDGRVAGKFYPSIDWSEWEPVTPEVTDEELRQLAKSNEPRYTTAEVLAYLEKL